MIKNLQTIRFITVSASQAAAGSPPSATNPRKELARVVEKNGKIEFQNCRVVTLLFCGVDGRWVCGRNGWYVRCGRWTPAKAR